MPIKFRLQKGTKDMFDRIIEEDFSSFMNFS